MNILQDTDTECQECEETISNWLSHNIENAKDELGEKVCYAIQERLNYE